VELHSLWHHSSSWKEKLNNLQFQAKALLIKSICTKTNTFLSHNMSRMVMRHKLKMATTNLKMVTHHQLAMVSLSTNTKLTTKVTLSVESNSNKILTNDQVT
jgi:uncharacterized membrane protein YgdD (TMEM256/DUF423 family)